MATNSATEANTRQRLLESARDLFAERGFAKTRNRDICAQAGANIAAVNYYFGSKENLYAEAWRRAFQDSMETHPPDGGVPPQAPAEERLQGRIRALIHGNADPDNKSFRIAHREMTSPTRLLEEVMRECLEPLHGAMTELVREMLGPGATEQQVRFCEVTVISACMGVARWRHFHAGLRTEDVPSAPIVFDDIDAYAEHVAQFSMAGIRAMRAQVDKRTWGIDETGVEA